MYLYISLQLLFSDWPKAPQSPTLSKLITLNALRWKSISPDLNSESMNYMAKLNSSEMKPPIISFWLNYIKAAFYNDKAAMVGAHFRNQFRNQIDIKLRIAISTITSLGKWQCLDMESSQVDTKWVLEEAKEVLKETPINDASLYTQRHLDVPRHNVRKHVASFLNVSSWIGSCNC